MSIEFGMPTLIELAGLEENARLCNSLGLKFIELNMNLPQYQVEILKNSRMFQDISKEYKVYYTIHLEENLNISDFNNAVTKAYLDTVKQSLLVVKELGVPLLNMHLSRGVYFTLPDQKVFLFDKYRDIYLKNIQNFKVMCETVIGGEGINISIENTDGFTTFQKEAIDILLDSSIFTLTWDIGHSYSASNVDEKYIMQNECKLKHFHIHDAIGKQNHLTLGEGNINLLEKLNIARRNHCRCVIETKTVASLQESLNWLVTHWSNK